MKNLKLVVILILAFGFLASCKQNSKDDKLASSKKGASIQLFAQDRPGGEPFDFNMPIDKGLDKLEIIEPSNLELEDDELIVGMSFNNAQIAIPIKYLSGFEVANLSLQNDNFLLTWCPLVGSARIFEGEIKGDKSGFDFGRGLKDNNLLIIDRKTNTVWNQLSCKAIKGELEGEHLSPLASIQSTWEFWKAKYPNTRVAINRDTTNAVFPQDVLKKQFYNTWIPGEKYPSNSDHQIQNLGLGIDLGSSTIFFPLENLFEESSPVTYTLENTELRIHFDSNGLTAWAEDNKGDMIPSTIVYNWAWNNFYPNSIVFKNNAHNNGYK